MTKTITPSLVRKFTSEIQAVGITHDSQRTIPVSSTQRPRGTPFQKGCRFHRMLSQEARSVFRHEEKKMVPWLSAAHRELRDMGVRNTKAEVSFTGDSLPNGRVDMLLTGGLAKRGCAEFKVVQNLPDQPAEKDLLQVGGYASLIAHEYQDGRVWIALIYVSFTEGIRIFSHKASYRLQSVARTLLAA